MKLACNIDQRGKKARVRVGSITVLCGIGLIVWGVRTDSRAILAVGIFVLVTGAFMIFEGVRGWCALRAMGIKMRM